ncbi:MAG TPA: HEAT repeat domain-containing protein [Syntrophales bacterium]|nr:HEAT repeat domain-containing protein [Syntrophales bacterium]
MEHKTQQPVFGTEESMMAKAIIDTFLRVMKIYATYPPTHTNTQQAIASLHESFTSFLKMFGEFALEIRKDSLLYEGAIMYQGSAQEGDLSFTFFRDGIRELVFQENIDLHEVETLVTLLHRYKNLPEETEDDLVTALWETNLPHVQYDAVASSIDQILTEGLIQQDNAPRKKTDAAQPGSPPSIDLSPAPTDAKPTTSNGFAPLLHDIPVTPQAVVFELTPDEILRLQQLVALEEKMDPTAEILDMFVDILPIQEGDPFFFIIMDFLKEEVFTALKSCHLDFVLKILEGLRRISRSSPGERSGALIYIENFFQDVSSQEYLDVLQTLWSASDSPQLEKIKRILLLLPADIIQPLGAHLPDVTSTQVYQMLTDVMQSHAQNDIRPLEALTESADENVIKHCIPILAGMQGQKPIQILLKMTHSPSETVRTELLRTFIKCNIWAPEKLFSLIEHKNSAVRAMLLKYLGSRKSEASEDLLISYLKDQSRSLEKRFLFSCFKTLGLCGSHRSLPFLSTTLLKGNIPSRFAASGIRQGAAIALAALGTQDALQVIRRASRSRFPGVRNAARAVIDTKTIRG